MKQNSLVQLIVIYFGISSIYVGISYLLPDIAAAFAHLFGDNISGRYLEVTYLVGFVLFIAAGLVIITKSGYLSSYISERASLDDNLKVYTKSSHLLSIFIVILALGRLLEYVPQILHDFYLMFTGTANSRSGSYSVSEDKTNLFNDVLNVLLPCLMIIFCKSLTEYFSKNILLGKDDIVIEHETITIEITDAPEQV